MSIPVPIAVLAHVLRLVQILVRMAVKVVIGHVKVPAIIHVLVVARVTINTINF